VNDPVQEILLRLQGVKPTGQHQWQARCPAHDDQHASLCVGQGADGRALVYCQAGCSTFEIRKVLDLPWSAFFPPGSQSQQPSDRIVATYDYRDAAGELLFQVVRFDPKDFRQRRPDGSGGWLWELGETPRVLYRLPELLAAEASAWIFVVEGEKDADNLAALGLVATCNPGGAGKWSRLSDDSALHGRPVAILPDKDDPGRKHAQDVAARLTGKAAEVRIVSLPGPGKDVSDWIAAGGTGEQLLALVESGADAQPVEDKPESDGSDSGPDAIVPLGSRDPRTGRLVLSPRRTLPTAQAFVKEFCSHPDGRMLHCYAGMLLTWENNRYVEIEDNAIGNRLQRWLHEAMKYVFDRKTNKLELVDFDSNPGTVKAALDTIRTYTHLSASVPTPSWLVADSARPRAEEILPCRTLNLHIPTGKAMPATPGLFTTAALAFDYDAQAPLPTNWLRFLQEIWDQDQQSIDLLQEWFGYCLTADTQQQKMLLLVGPRRSGKGTIGRVLRKLVGEGNVVGPTTGSLAGPFGLQPLIGKSLAIVSDARFRGNDMPIIVERLLCISGEDALTIDRKHIGSVTMKLPTRFMLLTNELPRLDDASGALAGRFLILQMTQSFFGREDLDLTEKLIAELPGILLWALQGWVRLHQHGRFTQPASAESAVQAMEDLTSPVGAFVRECCDVKPGQRAWVDDLYSAWKSWCEREGRSAVTTRQTFGRDLGAAVPGITRRRGAGDVTFYDGISIKGGTV
jgi:putative DNA primase/helicase